MPAQLRHLDGSLASLVSVVQWNLFAEEEKEDVDMTCHCRDVQIRVVLLVALHYICAVLNNKKLHAIVATVLDCQHK